MKIEARPWRPQDLLDDLQDIINEAGDHYHNSWLTTLMMARDYLKEHFAEPKWIPVTDKLPPEFLSVLVCIPSEHPLPVVKEAYLAKGCWYAKTWIYSQSEITHWRLMPEPPKEESQ